MPCSGLFPGADKDYLKQKMLEHESVFKNQVFELHRLYGVQKNLMDDIRNREQYEDRTRYETSSSSNALPSQMTPDDAHKQNSSRFLFTNSVCSAPPASNPQFIRSSAGDIFKGKGVQDARIPFKNCASPKNSESRPTKLRKMIDLELPADMYVDIDEMEQCRNRMTYDTEEKLFPSQHEKTTYHETHSESDSRLSKRYALADLNEPPEAEETTADPRVDVFGAHRQDILTKVPNLSEDVSWKTKHWNFNWMQSSSGYSNKGNGQNWLSSALKAEGNKDSGRTIHQTNQSEMPYQPVQVVFENHQRPRIFPSHLVKQDSFLAKANNDLIMYEKSNALSSSSNPGRLMYSPQPSYACSSNLVNSWNLPSEKTGNHLSQKSMSVQMTPFLDSESLSKSSHSSAQGNGMIGNWHRNAIPRSNSVFQSETPVHNGFYHGSSSGRYRESPPHFSKAGMDYGSGSCNNIATSGSFLKATSSLDLNSKRDLDLNVVPDDLSNESLTWQGEAEQKDSVSVVPWLRARASDNEVVRSRNGPDNPKCEHDPRELCNRQEVSNALDHQSCLTSTSSNIDASRGKEKVISGCPSSVKRILGVPMFQSPLSREQEIDSGKKKLPFDINVPFEEFDNTAATNEVILVERIESHRNMFDLNSCITEDEIPSRTSLTNSSTTTISTKKPERCIIDLEAPPDVEAEEDSSIPDEESMLKQQHEKLAREAAEAIVALSSSSALKNHSEAAVMPEDSGDVLSWFAYVVCDDVETFPDDKIDCLSSDPDSFEEMNLNLIECTAEEYFAKPPNFEFLGVEEAAAPTIVMGQTRRTRRGRQRRDFQRDILPGLTSLARHEITEDIQTFGGLMRATGYAWHCGGRKNSSRNGSGRGRRRTQVQACPPSAPVVNATPFASQKQSPSNGEVTLEDRSLTGWGKTTRRPRRQRCAPSSR